MKRWLIPAGAVLAVTGGSAAPAQDRPVEVAATVGMIADVARTVGGPCADVAAIMGPGVDPHLYQPSAGDVSTFRDADVILFAGYSLEGQLGDVLERFSETTPTVAVGPSSIDPGDLITVQDIYGIDPHLWMDASLWAQTVPTIAPRWPNSRPAAPTRSPGARKPMPPSSTPCTPGWRRASRPSRRTSASWSPPTTPSPITAGPTASRSPASKASARNRRPASPISGRWRQTVAERRVPAVFIESTINPRTIQAVIDAAAERGHQVSIGGELLSDAMGEPGTAAGTYIGMIHGNHGDHHRGAGRGAPAPAAGARRLGRAMGAGDRRLRPGVGDDAEGMARQGHHGADQHHTTRCTEPDLAVHVEDLTVSYRGKAGAMGHRRRHPARRDGGGGRDRTARASRR